MTAELWVPYCGSAPSPTELWARWNLDPALLAALVLLAMLLAAARRRAGGQPGVVVGAIAILLIRFVSPLCALTSALFSVRAVHHVLLMIVAAPLVAECLRPGWERVPAGLAAATLVQALAFWLWHAPTLYAAALANDALYWLMQLSVLLAASAFWMAIRSASAPAAVAALLATMVQMGLLGALITFAPTPLYAPHAATTMAWGLSPLEDQQLAGLIMWVPAAGFYLGAALLILARALGGTLPRPAE